VSLVCNCRPRWLVRTVALAAAVALAPQVAFAQAVSPIDFGAASLADPRLGVAVAAMAELADTPALLARPSSQQFIDDAFSRIAEAAPTDVPLRSRAERWRDALRVGEGSFDRDAAYTAVGDLSKNLLRAVGAPRDKLIALGILSEQAFYNARVLHDPVADGGVRAAIGANDAADTLIPGLRDLRDRVAMLGFKHWPEIADGAEKIVAALLGSTLSVPFPASPAVWLVLMRTRSTGVDKARKAEHYWLDIVHFDGTHQTIGAYPDGTTAFDHDTRKLVCALDKESDEVSSRTIPVQPGPGTTSAQLATTLVRLCNDARMSGLRYRVKDADDDRFIADALFRAGVAVAPLLRAAVSSSR
jgi:hypothetical protein